MFLVRFPRPRFLFTPLTWNPRSAPGVPTGTWLHRFLYWLGNICVFCFAFYLRESILCLHTPLVFAFLSVWLLMFNYAKHGRKHSLLGDHLQSATPPKSLNGIKWKFHTFYIMYMVHLGTSTCMAFDVMDFNCHCQPRKGEHFSLQLNITTSTELFYHILVLVSNIMGFDFRVELHQLHMWRWYFDHIWFVKNFW